MLGIEAGNHDSENKVTIFTYLLKKSILIYTFNNLKMSPKKILKRKALNHRLQV